MIFCFSFYQVYLQGTGFAFWSTRGDGVYKLYTLGSNVDGVITGRTLITLQPHPTDPNYVLRTVNSEDCYTSGGMNCSISVSEIHRDQSNAKLDY
jgi:hypothetical protein